MLFFTVWQHVSFGPCHYATTHWYSPTVLQPGMQNNHGKNKILGKNTNKTCSPPMYPLYLQARVWMHATTIHAKAPMQVSLFFPGCWPQALPITDLLSVLDLCSAFEKSSAPDTCHQKTSHKSLPAQMTDSFIGGWRCQFSLYSLQTNCDSYIQKLYLAPTQSYTPGVRVMVHTVCLLVHVYDM